MSNFYQDLAKDMAATTSIEQLKQKFLSCIGDTGLDKFTYQIVEHNFHHNLSNFYVTNFSEEWEKRYLEQNYFTDDPLVTQYVSNPSSFTWGREKSPAVTDRTAKMFYEANDFNLDRGIGIPIPGPGNSFSVLTLCSSGLGHQEIEKLNNEAGKDLMIAALLFHSGVISLNLEEAMHQQYDLTNKETDCLKLMCIGKSFADIAYIHGVSISAIKKRALGIYQKLGVGTRHEAVLKALKYKIIEG